MASGVELATAWVRIVPTMTGASDEISKELNKADLDKVGEDAGKKYTSGFGGAMKVGLTAAAGLAIAGIAKVFSTGIEELKIGEQISAQTDQLIENTGAGFSTQWVEDYTLALSKVSGISEEDLQTAGNSVLKFGDVSEDTYARSVDAINNMGSAGKDVAGVGEALGKALADPAAAAGLLKRQGVILNEEQQALIDNFIAVGDKAGAQGVILDSLEGTYGGMAEATGGTMQGNLNKLSNLFENLSATAVETLLPAITGIVEGLTGFFTFISENQGVATALAIAIGVVTVAIIAATAAMWALSLTPIVAVILAIIIGIGLLIAAIVFLVMNWDQVWAWIADIFQGFVGWITGVINGFVGWWNSIWAGVGRFIADVWRNIQNGIQAATFAFINWVMGAINGFVGWWNGVWSGIGNVIRDVFGNIGDFIGGIWSGIVSIIRNNVNTIIRVINGMIDGLNDLLSGIGGLVGLNLSLPKIPGLATGGTITHGGTVLVGERGPELLNLPRGASVDPDISGGGNGRTVIQHITTQQTDPRVQARQWGREAGRAFAAS